MGRAWEKLGKMLERGWEEVGEGLYLRGMGEERGYANHATEKLSRRMCSGSNYLIESLLKEVYISKSVKL